MLRLLVCALLVLGPESPVAAQVREVLVAAPLPVLRDAPLIPAVAFSAPALTAAPAAASLSAVPSMPPAAAAAAPATVLPAARIEEHCPLARVRDLLLIPVDGESSVGGDRMFDGAARASALSGVAAFAPSAPDPGPRLAGSPQSRGELYKKELLRKAFHVTGLSYLLAYHLIGWPRIAPAMAGWAALCGAVELLRLKAPWAKPLFAKAFGKILRAKEEKRFSGFFYGALGLAVSLGLYGANPKLAAAAVLGLFLGDAVSPLVGMRFGVGRFKIAGVQRSLDGAAAGFLVALSIGLALGFGPLAAIGAALTFSAVDVFPVKPDDNLWIPIAFSSALFFLSRLH